MSKEDTKDLIKFLTPFSKEIQEIALWLREFVWDLYPNANELIYDNYNAVAFGWTPSEKMSHIFCSIAVGTNKYVHFGFYWGSKIKDPQKILLGNGSQYRYIKVKVKSDFPKAYIKDLLKEAYTYSLAKMNLSNPVPAGKKQLVKGTTVTKSISPIKKRPGVTPLKKKKVVPQKQATIPGVPAPKKAR
jgi:hypothetical protein